MLTITLIPPQKADPLSKYKLENYSFRTGNHLTSAVVKVSPSKVKMLLQHRGEAINTLKGQLHGKKQVYLGTDLRYWFRRANSCPLTESIAVHDLESEMEIYSNLKNINTALHSCTLLKQHPVNTHKPTEGQPKPALVSHSAVRHSPAATTRTFSFPCPLPEPDFCH